VVGGIENTPLGEEGGVYRAGGDVAPAVRIAGDPPSYPKAAREAGIQGVVILDVIIDERGGVERVSVLKTLSIGLDEAAVRAVKGWKFRPATLQGRPVRVQQTLSVNFRLE